MNPVDPEVKVVDRRWWAREADEGTSKDTASTLKPTYVEELEQQLAEKDRQLQSTIAKYREASGEFEQSRARIRKDVMKDLERTRRSILADLLEVVDNLDRAIDAARENPGNEALVQGVELVRNQFLSKLGAHGVRRVNAAGERFDPARHEALVMMSTDNPEEDGIIGAVIAPGYVIGDEVLRPATVAVRKHGTSEIPDR
jgi:molecular chaperone GrpE